MFIGHSVINENKIGQDLFEKDTPHKGGWTGGAGVRGERGREAGGEGEGSGERGGGKRRERGREVVREWEGRGEREGEGSKERGGGKRG